MRGYAPARCAQVSRRPATAADADYLRALFTESRDDLLVLPDLARAALLDMQYRGQGRQIAAGHPAATREVLVADGTDAGLLILDRDPERVHVVDIVVARAHRRRGIASSTLRAVIDEAGERTVTLSVWPGNIIARSLYERLGFVPSTPSQIPGGYLPMEHRPGQ